MAFLYVREKYLKFLWGTHIVSIDVKLASKRINLPIPVDRLVDDLEHTRVTVLVVCVDDFRHPSEPLYGATVVVVVVEVCVGVVLASERLVGNLSSWPAVKTASYCQ